MDTAIVKFLILWLFWQNVLLTTSMALKEVANEDVNTREKRSPANNFSLFGLNLGNPISSARESFSSLGNIFSGPRGNTRLNNNHEADTNNQENVRNANTLSPADFPNRRGVPSTSTPNDDLKGDRYTWAQNVRSTNSISPTVFPNRSGIPNTSAKNSYVKEDRYIWPQEYNSEGGIPDTSETPTKYSVAPENTADKPGNEDIDEKLIYDIFQKPYFDYDSAGTTVDNNIDFVTETGETEMSTLSIRLGPEVVASLLG